jgi:hypothetical protein
MITRLFRGSLLPLAGLLLVTSSVLAQSAAFTYQGRLTDGGNPANSSYDMQFKLFDTVDVGTGTQQGATITNPAIQVTNGTFAVALDFGAGNLRNATAIGANAVVSQSNSLVLGSNANVGVGTTAPNTRLAVRGGGFWTSNFWIGSISLQNGSAIGWEANASGQRFGIGQSTGGLSFFRTISRFGATLTPAIADLFITDNGDLQQPLDRNGLVKAMAYITYDGTSIPTLRNCYNGVTNNSSGECGFIYGPVNLGIGFTGTRINFGFEVNNRFIVITGIQAGRGSVWDFPNAMTVDIEGAANGFYLIVY